MNWILLSVLSAVFLGGYDLLKKAGVRENAVPPVLFFSVLAGASVWAPLLLWSHLAPETYPSAIFLVRSMTWTDHGLIFSKSLLVSSSWVFNYFAVKHLPVSVSSPIRATSPVWTILIAVTLMGERPAPVQWGGISVILVAFVAFSVVGRREGIYFHRDRWVAFMLLATLIGALSALYDKFLLQTRGMEAATVQCWFSLYLPLILGPFYGMWRLGRLGKSRFEWRWSIPLIGIVLLVADFFYFLALGHEGALISVVSPLRRCAVLVTFLGGIVIYREKHVRPKLICILVLLGGVVLLNWTN